VRLYAKNWGVTWFRPRLFCGKLLAHPLGFSKCKLYTKFKVSSSSSFENIFDCMPKILGVTWPRPRPFWGKLFARPLGYPQMKRCTKFEVSSSSSFEDIFNRIPKILEVTWPRPRPFWGKLFQRPLGFSKRKLCVPNLKSLAQVVLTGVGRGRICLASFNSPTPKTPCYTQKSSGYL